MIFFEPGPVKKAATLQNLIASIDPYFEKGWKNYREEILKEMTCAAKDYTFLNEFIHSQVLSGEWPKLYGTQTFLCYEGKEYFIRLNLWFPEKELPEAEQVKNYFSIGLLHNHNFPLFTTGLFGPGYTTKLFRWDKVTYNRKVGETLEIDLYAEPTLSLGAALYIEEDADFHLQHWPQTFSISLNVIPTTQEDYTPCQYILNHDRTIHEVLYTGLTPGSRQKR